MRGGLSRNVGLGLEANRVDARLDFSRIDVVACGGVGATLGRLSLGLGGCVGSVEVDRRSDEGDKDLGGEGGVGGHVLDGGAEVEGAKEVSLAVVPDADEAIECSDDELERVGGVEEEARDLGAAFGGVERGGGGCGGRGEGEGRQELSSGDRVDFDGGSCGDETVPVGRSPWSARVAPAAGEEKKARAYSES